MIHSWPDFKTAYYTSEWIIRLGALAVVPQRRTPAAARSWLLLIFFLPVAGLLLFLAIGSPNFPAWRKQRFQRLLPYFAKVAEQLKPQTPDLGDAAAIAELAHKAGLMPAVGGNQITLIDDYQKAVGHLIADIDAARHSVSLLVYIFADDAIGRDVAGALERAVGRGVACRVMFDPVGSRQWRRKTLRLLNSAGVEVREALPFRLLRRRTRRDMRNHRKLFVIDGRIGYAGSQNIVSQDFRPDVVNRELVVRVTGPIVASISAMIESDWTIETGDSPEEPGPIPEPTGPVQAHLLPSGPNYPLEGFETLLVWQLHQARHRVTIVTPYFIPDDRVIGAMCTAAARGVVVDLVVSAVVDQRLVNLSQSSFYDELLHAGVRVNLFRDYLLHAKNVSIDGKFAIVGSSNVDLRSFQLNEEVSLILYDQPSVAAVETIQRGYLDASDQLGLEDWRRRPALRKLLENIARLLNSLL